MSTFELKNIDCLEYIKTMPDNSTRKLLIMTKQEKKQIKKYKG